MKTKAKTFATAGVMILLLGGMGVLGVAHLRLTRERDGLLAERASLEEKASMLKKSYSEQRAQADSSLRARQAAEAKLAKASQQVSEQGGALQALTTKVEELETRLKTAKRPEAVRDCQAEAQQALAPWKTKVEELQTAHAASQAKMKTLEARSTELEGVAASAKATLENETKVHKSCRDKNATLARIARDLAKSYEGRGILDTLATKEPLTQLKKVELEKLVQEYLDQIDTETLPKTGAVR